MLLTQPPERRSRFTNLVHNFFFTHKVVVHISSPHIPAASGLFSRDRSQRIDIQFKFVPAAGGPARSFTLARA